MDYLKGNIIGEFRIKKNILALMAEFFKLCDFNSVHWRCCFVGFLPLGLYVNNDKFLIY